MAITLFPLLVSNTVSKNVVPGVCKVLENFIMVYGLEAILTQLRGERTGNYLIRNNKIIKKESDSSKIFDISNFLYNEMLEEQSVIYNDPDVKPGSKGKGKTQRQASTPSGKSWTGQSQTLNVPDEITVNVKGSDKDKEKDASVRLDAFNLETLTLEPTWMKMDQFSPDGVKTSGIIGVKVIPYLVKSDISLGRLLMYDKQVGKLQRMAILIGRKTNTLVYNTFKRLWRFLPFTSPNEVVSGDPRQDILLKRSIYHSDDIQNIFALANQADLTGDFMGNAREVVNLQKMGWGSLIIADDVNRRVAFCMKELKGLCSMMPYTMLYETFKQAKVYTDIEDAKRTASSIFKVKREKLSKLIGEGIAQDKVEAFSNQNLPLLESEFITEVEYIDESIAGFMKTLTPAKLKILIPKIIQGSVEKIPTTSIDKIVKMGTKLNPEFRKGYMLAKQVISNSEPAVSEPFIDGAALTVAIRASLKGTGNFMIEVKNGIKSFIKLFRRSKMKAKKEKLPPEHMVDATIGWVIISLFLLILTTIVTGIITHSEKLNKFIVLLSKNIYAKISGIDSQTLDQSIEDWSAAAWETAKEQAVDNGAWIALGLIVIIIIRKLLKAIKE